MGSFHWSILEYTDYVIIIDKIVTSLYFRCQKTQC
jgi:hypothetical protein